MTGASKSSFRGLAVAICFSTFLPAIAHSKSPITKGEYVYGLCMKEAADAAVAALKERLPEEGPYRVEKGYGEYDRITAGIWENTLKQRTVVPMRDKNGEITIEMITWASKRRSVSVFIQRIENEGEKSCVSLDVEISEAYN